MATTFMLADDGTYPNLGREEIDAMIAERRLFELHSYYESIEPHTFKTDFVELSEREAGALRIWCVKELEGDDAAVFGDLKERLGAAVGKLRGESGVFVRLSTRSPKDAPDKLRRRFVPLVRRFVSQEDIYGVVWRGKNTRLSEGDELVVNRILVGVRRALFHGMKSETAAEALDLFRYSARAISDLKRAVDYADRIAWDLHFIVRPFVDIPLEGEFRSFVSGGKLRALSQYYCDCYFPWVAENEAAIIEAVQTFFAKTVQLPEQYGNAVVDVVVFSDLSIKIIELNPFGPTTGGCMFGWDEDREVLESGPFEFRFISKPRPRVEALLRPFHRSLDAAYPPLVAKDPAAMVPHAPQEEFGTASDGSESGWCWFL